MGLTCRWIASDTVFNRLSLKFNALVVVTLILLRMWGESNFIDFVNFEISKVTFREAMGLLTLMMAYFYYLGSLRWIVSELLELNDPLAIERQFISQFGDGSINVQYFHVKFGSGSKSK
ncbi:hypothetical protein ISN44_As03g036080 [Arabidopsis suecica]|uniref:Uncharacterized protein n=1 Tax=Arabidopsis suecica TaxID=45249 RepID=A0A8T2FEG1_ARASU|nr:hypothetical protein ISN44_As03g036080 [Arabidopsis suecica]